MQPRRARDATALERLLDRCVGRFAYVGLDNLEAFAEAFARTLRATEIPRDPFHLLDTLGISLQPTASLPPRRALWTREGNRYTIFYSRYDRPATARFSLWHEAFEMLAERPGFPSSLPPATECRLADRFAALMLMPRRPLLAQAATLQENRHAMPAVLAARFGVSITAMRLRLRELGMLTERTHPRHPGAKVKPSCYRTAWPASPFPASAP